MEPFGAWDMIQSPRVHQAQKPVSIIKERQFLERFGKRPIFGVPQARGTPFWRALVSLSKSFLPSNHVQLLSEGTRRIAPEWTSFFSDCLLRSERACTKVELLVVSCYVRSNGLHPTSNGLQPNSDGLFRKQILEEDLHRKHRWWSQTTHPVSEGV